MAGPRNVTITIEDTKIQAYSAQVGMDTMHDGTGMPNMGQQLYSITVQIDAHDTENVNFSAIRRLFELSQKHVRAHIVPMKVTFWTDDSQTDVIAEYRFEGWISRYIMHGGGGVNHNLTLRLVPKIGLSQYSEMEVAN